MAGPNPQHKVVLGQPRLQLRTAGSGLLGVALAGLALFLSPPVSGQAAKEAAVGPALALVLAPNRTPAVSSQAVSHLTTLLSGQSDDCTVVDGRIASDTFVATLRCADATWLLNWRLLPSGPQAVALHEWSARAGNTQLQGAAVAQRWPALFGRLQQWRQQLHWQFVERRVALTPLGQALADLTPLARPDQRRAAQDRLRSGQFTTWNGESPWTCLDLAVFASWLEDSQIAAQANRCLAFTAPGSALAQTVEVALAGELTASTAWMSEMPRGAAWSEQAWPVARILASRGQWADVGSLAELATATGNTPTADWCTLQVGAAIALRNTAEVLRLLTGDQGRICSEAVVDAAGMYLRDEGGVAHALLVLTHRPGKPTSDAEADAIRSAVTAVTRQADLDRMASDQTRHWHWQNILTQLPDSPRGRLARAFVLWDLGQLEAAREALSLVSESVRALAGPRVLGLLVAYWLGAAQPTTAAESLLAAHPDRLDVLDAYATVVRKIAPARALASLRRAATLPCTDDSIQLCVRLAAEAELLAAGVQPPDWARPAGRPADLPEPGEIRPQAVPPPQAPLPPFPWLLASSWLCAVLCLVSVWIVGRRCLRP
jgi:hypothetical protein